MQVVNDALNAISAMLLLPTMIALVAGFFVTVYLLYNVFQSSLRRPRLREDFNQVKSRGVAVLANCRQLPVRKRLWSCLAEISYAKPGVQPESNRLLSEFEIACAKESELARMLVRLGPMLGLMGTLIPMGPALTALGSGDMQVMAQNLQIAFATTVIGIVVGGAGFIAVAIMQRWQAEEMVVLESALSVAGAIHA